MKRLLSLIFFISTVMSFRLSVAQTDSLKPSKNSILIGFNYGIPLINRLNLSYDKGTDNYWVDSRHMGFYNIMFSYMHKHFYYQLGVSYIKSEFKGTDFKINAPNSPPNNSYYLFQDVKYNVAYVDLGFGYNQKISRKQNLNIYLSVSIPAVYDITINNMYSKEHQVNDTSLYTASKNAFNTDKQFGHFPRFSLGVSYDYYVLKNMALNVSLNFMYAITWKIKYPDDDKVGTVFNHSNSYSFLAYDINNQYILTPSVGIKFRFKQ